MTKNKECLLNLIALVGGEPNLAKIADVKTPTIYDWKNSGQIPAARVIQIEAATGISRHDLRPDIYPREIEIKEAAHV